VVEKNSWIKFVTLGCAAVTVIDTVGSVVSRAAAISYAYFGVLSLVAYVGLGFLVRKSESLLLPATLGMSVAVYDATIGWSISWMIGPGRVAIKTTLSAATIVFTAVTSVGMATLIVVASAAISRMVCSRREQERIKASDSNSGAA